MIALNAKNKMKLVNGDFPEPAIDSNLRPLWERNNDMLISWILNTVSGQISNNLNFINYVSKLWVELQEHYAQIDGHMIFQLTNDMVQLKQENCSIEVYYHKLKGFQDEYDALEAPYMCTCVCNCNNRRINGERDQRKRLIQFLMGLDESYCNIRGQILLMQYNNPEFSSTAKSTYFIMITIVRGTFSLYYIICITNISICNVTCITKVDELTQPTYGNPIFIYVKKTS
ncbi:hypothetical protein Tco_1000401 [Tanacetum coccineum]